MSSIEQAELNYSNLLIQSVIADKQENVNKQLENMPSVLDKQAIRDFQEGKYPVTLEEYTNLSTYRTTMSALYGNSSANKTESSLKTFLGIPQDKAFSAKDFMDVMKEDGISNGQALKLYTALKSYSAIASMQKYNYVNAKI